MPYTRRDIGKLALAAPVMALAGCRRTDLVADAIAAQAARPNSVINGVRIGTITYSFRSMPDQSAEATLQYCVDSGISAVELMGGPINDYARRRTGFEPPSAGGGRGGGGGGGRGRGGPDPSTLTASWNGRTCAPEQPGGDPVMGDEPLDASAGGGATPEALAAREAERQWRMGLSMDIFRDLRQMYNDAGVAIYAVKEITGRNLAQASAEDVEFEFAVAEALGATHVTLELPSGPTAKAELERLGDWAVQKKIYAAYHTHAQGSMAAFDEAFAISPGNMANVDFGHFVAGGNRGGTPIDFLNRYHARIASYHLKDRTLPEHCALNLPWGEGETPIAEILRTVQRNGWSMPASIELEYPVPDGSNAVAEVRRCLDFCRAALL